jgi:hypothetical protein
MNIFDFVEFFWYTIIIMKNQSNEDQIDVAVFALNEADRYRILASEYNQLGFKELARWLRKNADAAMKWGAKSNLICLTTKKR